MTNTGQAIDLIQQLSQLVSRLQSNGDASATKEALQLSKKLTATLERPEDVAVALAFSVIHLQHYDRVFVPGGFDYTY